ncbi:MAG: hypothetical protein AB7H77_10405, partial [Bdellovibrionales bacterium]
MNRPFPVFAPLLFALAGAQMLFVYSYIEHERTFYFWDHAMYYGMARQFYEIAARDPAAGLSMLGGSLGHNYNLLFAVPSLFTFSLFGPSRLVFILTNFGVFFLAYELAVAFFFRRAMGVGWRVALAASFGSALLIPPLWLPLLEGYPDNGAAACIVLAAALGWGVVKGPGSLARAA